MKKKYSISDIVNEQFLQLPLSLLANPIYKDMTLEAKVLYSLLLNRMTLSQKNGWVNDNNEVYLVYTRKEASDTLNISYKKTVSAFKELIEADLLIEERQGRGLPNLIYVLHTKLENDDALNFNKNFDDTNYSETNEECYKETAVTHADTQMCKNDTSRKSEMAHQEKDQSEQKEFQMCKNDTSRSVKMTHLDMSNRHIRKIDNNYINNNYNSMSDSHNNIYINNNTDIAKIFEKCDMEAFDENTKNLLVSAIERLYYAESFTVDNVTLPQSAIRKQLSRLTDDILSEAVKRMKKSSQVKRPISYLMAIILNTIPEIGSTYNETSFDVDLAEKNATEHPVDFGTMKNNRRKVGGM